MPYSMIVYPTPLDAAVMFTPDATGTGIPGGPYTAPDGRPGQIIYVPDDIPDQQGAWLTVERDGYVPMHVRGFLALNPETQIARLQVDDYMLVASGDPIDPVDPDSTRTPQEIIDEVYRTTDANLHTHDGCGQFTEAVCDALHREHSQKWGHVAKTPGQNQYNGHAVDAVMLLGTAKGVAAGTYDIILDSVSPEAEPAFNHVGPADPNLWLYPAAVAALAFELQSIAARLTSWRVRPEGRR